MKYLPTEKLFYNKYPYKVECNVPHAGCLGHDRHTFTYNLLSKYRAGTTRLSPSTYPGAAINAVQNRIFRKFAEKVERYVLQQKDLDIKIRTEGHVFSLFCLDEKIIDELLACVPEFIDVIYKPEDEKSLDFLLNNNRKVLVKALPYKEYRYKITLREKMPEIDRERFNNWVIKFSTDGSKYHISGATARFLSNKIWYVQNPFFYAKTQGDASMATLFLGTNIKNIYEYIATETA